MRCGKIQRLLNRYIDNELTEDIQGHLAGCKGCTHRLNELTRIKELLGVTTAYQPNPFLLTRIASAIKEITPIPIGILRVWVPIATILILLAGFILYRLPEVEKPVRTTIFDIPTVPENMERITLNLLVYTNGEVPYVRF